jgi:hypothetical protein
MTHRTTGDATPFLSKFGSPLDTAISEASASHPSIIAIPAALRKARQVGLSAAAKAMASVCNIDFLDAENAVRNALQMVDEAALNIGTAHDRHQTVDLTLEIESRHHLLARALDKEVDLRAIGMNDALSLARVELAINRVLCARTGHVPDARSSSGLVKLIISTLVRSCLAGGVAIVTMTDHDLLEMVEDAADSSLLAYDGF